MTAAAMKLHDPQAYIVSDEMSVIERVLPLKGARVLELGCGRAWLTRLLMERFEVSRLVATEVDRIQHDKNRLIDDLPGVRFVYAGAEAIPEPDASFDRVLMFKSLHHVPRELMGKALAEIARVLRPGGLAYLSEPVYTGEFNDILKLFNDEQRVRQAAFDSIRQAVESGAMELLEQLFFQVPGSYRDFQAFEERLIKVTHTEHNIDEELYREIKARFDSHMSAEGAHFLKPMRVDLLRKPGV